jgi:hypothetical protein
VTVFTVSDSEKTTSGQDKEVARGGGVEDPIGAHGGLTRQIYDYMRL